jgi:hypothetical protein
MNTNRLKQPVAVKKPTVARRYPRHRRRRKTTIQECDWIGAGHGRRLRGERIGKEEVG